MIRGTVFEYVLLFALATLSLSGQASEVQFQQGLDNYHQGNFRQAEAVFSGLLKDGDNIAQLRNSLAAVYGAQGRYDRALNHLKLAVQHFTAANIAFDNLSKVYALMASPAYGNALGEKPTVEQSLNLVLAEGWVEESEPLIEIEKNTPAIMPFDEETARRELLATVSEWSEAWSAQDIDA